MSGTARIAGWTAEAAPKGMSRGMRWALVLGGLTLGPAAAAPHTGTGGGPETTVNAPYRAGTGQTVPPGRDAAPDADPTTRTERQKRLDGVLDSICRSCRDDS